MAIIYISYIVLIIFSMLKKTVDIILPVYNSKKYILTTINSVIRQNYNSWNLIIIDDCSNDGTYEIDSADPFDQVKKYWAYRIAKPLENVPVIIIES